MNFRSGGSKRQWMSVWGLSIPICTVMLVIGWMGRVPVRQQHFCHEHPFCYEFSFGGQQETVDVRMGIEYSDLYRDAGNRLDGARSSAATALLSRASFLL